MENIKGEHNVYFMYYLVETTTMGGRIWWSTLVRRVAGVGNMGGEAKGRPFCMGNQAKGEPETIE